MSGVLFARAFGNGFEQRAVEPSTADHAAATQVRLYE